MSIGESRQYEATVLDQCGYPMSGQSLDWSVNAPSVANVSSSGFVTALSAGDAIITVTHGGVSDFAALTVYTWPVP